jgi:hypothetical protein
MHRIFYFLIGTLLYIVLGSGTSFAQNPEEPCQKAQSQLRYYFMEYNDEGYLNQKYLEDLFYACDSVSLRSTICYYYLRSVSLLEVKEGYVAKPSELFYFYHNKFKEAAFQSASRLAYDPEFVSILSLRTDMLAAQIARAEAVGDQPYLNEQKNKEAAEKKFDQGLNFNSGGQRGSDQRLGDVERSAPTEVVSDFTAFPYPVKTYSDSYSFEGRTFQQARNLGDINRQLTAALHAEGYYGKRYFSMPEGFALVTQLESMYPDGTPSPTLERWQTSVKQKPQFSLREYLLSLVFAEKGYYRAFAFVVLPRSIADDPRLGMGRLDPGPWMTVSGEKLPDAVAELSVSNDYVVKAYLFAFDVPGGAENAILMTPSIGSPAGRLALKHLQQANLQARLQR